MLRANPRTSKRAPIALPQRKSGRTRTSNTEKRTNESPNARPHGTRASGIEVSAVSCQSATSNPRKKTCQIPSSIERNS